MLNDILDAYTQKESSILSWLDGLAPENERPIYSSVDIRHSGFKCAGIDTNLFPGGFNNLCTYSAEQAAKEFKKAILSKHPEAKHILIVCEEHTRNTWYLENVYTLTDIAELAGFKTTVATFMNAGFEHVESFIDVDTALNHQIRIYRLRPIIDAIQKKDSDIDCILLNNDLTDGIPEELMESETPVYPATSLGWHNRKKSTHFEYVNKISQDLCMRLSPSGDLDPWWISTLFETIPNVDINSDSDRERIMSSAETLFAQIQEKYTRYNIDATPYLFLKSDSGTYGMGVIPIFKPSDILNLNRKGRNKLNKGKGATPTNHYILQEGISTTAYVHDDPAEIVLYHIHNQLIGSFYRLNTEKKGTDNLNSRGMKFHRICSKAAENISIPTKGNVSYKPGIDCGIKITKKEEKLYTLLGKIAGVATYFEKENNT